MRLWPTIETIGACRCRPTWVKSKLKDFRDWCYLQALRVIVSAAFPALRRSRADENAAARYREPFGSGVMNSTMESCTQPLPSLLYQRITMPVLRISGDSST